MIVDADGSRGPRAYISDPSSSSLIVFDLHTQGLWKVPLTLSLDPLVDRQFNLRLFQLALTGSTLFMNPHNSDLLFKTDVSVLRALSTDIVDVSLSF